MNKRASLIMVLTCAAVLIGAGCEIVTEPDPGPGPGPVDPGPGPVDPGPGPVDPGPGPVDPLPPDVSITCDHFDAFTLACTDGCAPTWDCDLAYADLHVEDQYSLDVCADCLADALAEGVCADCSDPEGGVDSCQLFMEDLLGIDCW